MAENSPIEAPRGTPEAPEVRNPRQELLKLKELVEQGQFNTVVDTLMKEAVSKKDIPTEKVDAFVKSLDVNQFAAFQRFLEGKPANPRMASLAEKIRDLKAEISTDVPATLEALSGLSEPAEKVVAMLDKGIERLTAGGKLNQIAAKIGFKGEIGPAQLDFVKNFFLGYAAKFFEGMTGSLRKVNPTVDISKVLNLPLELRLINIKDPVQKAKYKAAYLKRAKESTGVFIAPTLEEALNPQTSTPAQPAATPPEATAAAPATGEKVEAKRTIKLTDGTIFDIERGSDKKTIVTAAGTKAEVKVVGGEVDKVLAIDAKDKDAATVTLQLFDGRSFVLDGKKLRDAVQNKTKEFTVNGTKIELTEIKN